MPTFRQQHVDAVIDVRSPMEFATGHLDGAHCVPVDTIEQRIDALPGLTKQSKILLYCASGGRSALAAQMLASMGYQHVVDGGGIASAQREFTP
jgi:phage shock protein E